MIQRYKTIYRPGEGEIIEKKSRFIASVQKAGTEEEALSFIESMKKKYWNARHNCYAYIIGERQELVRCSDDGEPGGTAGRPMLDVLQGAGLTNVVVVVTRYFGGVLLGTGGLVRAYSQAVQEGLANSVVIEKIWGTILKIETDYTGLGKIQYILAQEQIPILQTEYSDMVQLHIIIPGEETEQIKKKLIEATNGRAGLSAEEELYYAMDGKEVLLKEALEE